MGWGRADESDQVRQRVSRDLDGSFVWGALETGGDETGRAREDTSYETEGTIYMYWTCKASRYRQEAKQIQKLTGRRCMGQKEITSANRRPKEAEQGTKCRKRPLCTCPTSQLENAPP